LHLSTFIAESQPIAHDILCMSIRVPNFIM
jgi:hypothetical protein